MEPLCISGSRRACTVTFALNSSAWADLIRHEWPAKIKWGHASAQLELHLDPPLAPAGVKWLPEEEALPAGAQQDDGQHDAVAREGGACNLDPEYRHRRGEAHAALTRTPCKPGRPAAECCALSRHMAMLCCWEPPHGSLLSSLPLHAGHLQDLQ